MKTLFMLPVCLLLAGTLTACGGGSPAAPPAPDSATRPPAVPPTATVGIVLTDASVDDYDHAWVTITSVELIGEGGNELLFSGEQKIDLLALRDTLELFAVNADVKPGDYEKIRMIASDMTLTVDNADGTTTETAVKLVASDFSVFRLCSLKFSIQLPDNPVLESLCLDILVTDKTGLFGPDGNPMEATELKVTNPVTVLGRLRRSVDGSGNTALADMSGDVTPTVFQVQSIVVEGGAVDKWQQLRGKLQSTVDATTQTFNFLITDRQSETSDTVVTGRVFDSTRMFMVSLADGVMEIAAADLVDGDRAAVDGVLIPAEAVTGQDELRIAIMLARRPSIDLAAISGSILHIDIEAGIVMVTTVNGDRCVSTDVLRQT